MAASPPPPNLPPPPPTTTLLGAKPQSSAAGEPLPSQPPGPGLPLGTSSARFGCGRPMELLSLDRKLFSIRGAGCAETVSGADNLGAQLEESSSGGQNGGEEQKEPSPWVDISLDTFQLILESLPLSAFLNTRDVCTSWQEEAIKSLLNKPLINGLPWIVFDQVGGVATNGRVYYDITYRNFSYMHIPIQEGIRICSFWQGWVTLQDMNQNPDILILFNPISFSNTRVRIDVKEKILNPLAVFSHQPRDENCVILILGDQTKSIRRGDWKGDAFEILKRGTYTCYPVCIKGQFYLNCEKKGGYTGGKKLIVLDTSVDVPTINTIEMGFGEWWQDTPQQQFLFENKGNLCLARATYIKRNELKLKLFQADFVENLWVPMISIGETAVFISCNAGFKHGQCFSIEILLGSEIKKNTVYMTGSALPRKSLYVEYDLASHKVRYFPRPIPPKSFAAQLRYEDSFLHWFSPML